MLLDVVSGGCNSSDELATPLRVEWLYVQYEVVGQEEHRLLRLEMSSVRLTDLLSV